MEAANYVDSDIISDYARNAVDWLSEQEIVSEYRRYFSLRGQIQRERKQRRVFMRINEKLK